MIPTLSKAQDITDKFNLILSKNIAAFFRTFTNSCGLRILIGNILCFAKGRYHESAIFVAELNSEAARSRRSCNTDGEMTAWRWVRLEEMLEMDVFAPTLIAINLFLEKCEL